jgi:hypothetical protein
MTARIPSKRILTFDCQAQEQSASVTVKQAFATCVLLYLCTNYQQLFASQHSLTSSQRPSPSITSRSSFRVATSLSY